MAYTAEQLQWIEENLNVGVFRNQRHFVDVFNALFGEHVSKQAMATMLYKRGWHLVTAQNTSKWTAEMDEWLKEHYPGYGYDFVYMANDFNAEFNTDKSAGCVRKRTEKLGIHHSRPNARGVSKRKLDALRSNAYGFKKGAKSAKGESPIGTIKYSGGRPYIKVMLSNGQYKERKASEGRSGHNYQEPFWKPLQKKIWEDHYGEVPEGYVVCSLNGNPADTDINHIGLIRKRGTMYMVKNDWWNIDNVTMMKTAVRWCNLACIVKESEIKKGRET